MDLMVFIASQQLNIPIISRDKYMIITDNKMDFGKLAQMKKINRSELAQFGNLELLAKYVVEGFITGMHKSPFHGFSVEFAEHRLYNTGESTRHVDWKLYARTEKLFTKKYEEETNLRCRMVLDCSSSMLFDNDGKSLSKIEYAVYCIASLIELLKKQRDAVGLTTFNDHIEVHSEAKSSQRHHRFIYAELEKLMTAYKEQERKSTSTVQALHDVAELSHKRSLVIIFTDILDDPERKEELFQALQHLKHNKHEVILFHVINKEAEIDFDLSNRPYNFVDMETGEKIKLMPSQIKERYQQQTKAYFNEIEKTAGNYAIDFMQANVNEDFEQVLLRYLIKRDKMVKG
jgi:uncharacterized protein (DUF58 family)